MCKALGDKMDIHKNGVLYLKEVVRYSIMIDIGHNSTASGRKGKGSSW